MVHFGPSLRLGTRISVALMLLVTACSSGGQQQQPAAPAGATPGTQAQQPAASGGGNIVILSTQFTPVEEQAKMQNIILKSAPAQADYVPADAGTFADRITSEQKAGKVTISVLGGLHGDLDPFVKAGYLEDLSALSQKLTDRGIASSFMDLAHMGTKDKVYYIPWM